MTKKRASSGVKVKILDDNTYYKGADPVKGGTIINVSKSEAAKLVARGLAQEVT